MELTELTKILLGILGLGLYGLFWLVVTVGPIVFLLMILGGMADSCSKRGN